MKIINFTTPSKFAGILRRGLLAFTLIELLLVITIIGLLAAVGLPHLKGWGEANAMTAATRQLVDDLSYARQKAISSRSTVYVVFISSNIVDSAYYNILLPADKVAHSNLLGGQYTSYALYAPGSVGDQPGRPNHKYLTPWKSLPEKIFIAPVKFKGTTEAVRMAENDLALRSMTTIYPVPFPRVNDAGKTRKLPCIVFDSQGRLVSEKNGSTYENAVIPLTRGSIFYARDANGNLLFQPADVLETPPGNSISNKNHIVIDWLTGRAHVEREEFK